MITVHISTGLLQGKSDIAWSMTLVVVILQI